MKSFILQRSTLLQKDFELASRTYKEQHNHNITKETCFQLHA